MKYLAVITARGGSKRIPKKNIKDFLGKPIIAYPIQAAIASGLFEEVMVSTDDQQIADIALSYAANIPFMRSEKTSDDHDTTADVIFEVLTEYKINNKGFDYVCCIYPTAPFISVDILKGCVNILERNKADGLLPVVRFSYPPQRAFIMTESGKLQYEYPENIAKRSQDLQPLYHDAGQFYFVKADRFMQEKKMVMENTLPYFLNELSVQDIDTIDDWQIAEIKYQLLQNKHNI